MAFHAERMHETVARLADTYHANKIDYKYPKSRDVARLVQEFFPCAAWLTFGQIQLSIQWHQFSYCSYYRVAQDSTFYYDHPSCYKAEIALIALWASPTGRLRYLPFDDDEVWNDIRGYQSANDIEEIAAVLAAYTNKEPS